MKTVPPADGNDFPIDVTKLDYTQLVADLAKIRTVNAQRFEMEMLTGVVLLDPVRHVIVGFKDLTENEFWIRGHMPNYPLMPGVLMLEAAAQLVSFYGSSQEIVAGKLMGLATIDEARFLRRVCPGERLILTGRGLKVSRKINRFRCEGFVGSEKAFEAVVTGITLGDRKEMTGA